MGVGVILLVVLMIIVDMYLLDKWVKILGLNSVVWGIVSIFGLLVGGFIVDIVGWYWIFFINVFIGFVLLGLISIFLVELKWEWIKMLMDILGSVILMVVLLMLLLGF